MKISFLRKLITSALVVAPSLAVAQSSGDEDQERGELLEFQDWRMQCIRNENQQTRCSLFQKIGTEQGQTVLTVSVMLRPDNKPIVVYAVPLGVQIPAGLTIEIRNRYYKVLERNLLYSHCNRGGCYAISELDKTLYEVLIGGRSLTARFHTPAGKKVSVEGSLYGFTKGLISLKEKSP